MKMVIDKFLSLPYEQKCEMGKKGREKMENQFDRQLVIDKYFSKINN